MAETDGISLDRKSVSIGQAPISLVEHGLGAELRALKAVVRKEWIIFIRYPTWVLALFIWPVIFPAIYLLSGRALAGPDGSGLANFVKLTGTSNFMGFIVIGTVVWMWQNMVLWNVGFALRAEQMRGTLESNWLAPTWRFSLLLGSSAVQVISMLLFIVVTVIEFRFFFGIRFEGSYWLALIMLVASVPAVYGLGFAFASLVITAKEAQAFVFLVRGLVMIFCGITYPAAMLPLWMRDVARWLPPTYSIAGIRTALLTRATFAAILPDLASLLIFGAFWLAVGYVLFLFMENRARKTGALGQF